MILICFPVDQAEINNWKSIAESMEAKGDSESWFDLRARAIADRKADPLLNISELLADPCLICSTGGMGPAIEAWLNCFKP